MFRRNMFSILFISFIASSCSIEKGGVVTAPAELAAINNSGSSSSLKPLSLVIGTWTGTETATVGLSGSLSVTFTQPPTADANVTATIAWTNGITVHGTVTGTVDNMVITATDGPAGVCGYVAHGVLNSAGTQITGTYTGTGSGPNCIHKAGTFVLNGQSFVQVTCVDQFYQMNQGNDSAAQNACINRAGIWHGNGYDIPGDNSSTTYDRICEFTPNPPGNPGNDMLLIFQRACPVQ